MDPINVLIMILLTIVWFRPTVRILTVMVNNF